ncbi:MAG: FAD-dependent oxidoreductase [Rhodoferax sp.]|nr:FAD-dependent oxidoreductase [Rhodoferax sp.]
MKVAIVGSGISGLAVAHELNGHADVSLFEADDYFGGHSHTVDISLPQAGREVCFGVDTGFLVFNENTYPELIALFADLQVETAKSEMSFSVQVALGNKRQKLEWSGASLNTVFAQRRNLFNPAFLGMLRDLARFNKLTTRIADSGTEAALQQPLGEFLSEHQFSDAFCDWYFLPMMGCIWSCPTAQMLQFPVATMIRFCHNHGLIQVRNRPQWHTVKGGAKHYVEKIVAKIADKRLNTPVRNITRLGKEEGGGIAVATDQGREQFDQVVLATHTDQALALLHDASPAERRILGAIRYQHNHAVLHTDTSVLPAKRTAWAAWNYESAGRGSRGAHAEQQVCLHYLINLLQPLPWAQPVVVSLNPLREIPRHQIMGEYDYAHPVFDLAALAAQRDVAQLQGKYGTYFCGAWMGYGFHEDGLKAGQGVARQIMAGLGAQAAVPA